MSATVEQVYRAALALIDEEPDESLASRTPGIINTLIGRCFDASEEYETGAHSLWTPVAEMSDELEGIDRTIALSAMPYGLAAMLVLGYDPVKSRALWSVFIEQVELARKTPESFVPIENVYGAGEHGGFGRW